MVLIGDICKMNDPKSFVQMFSAASLSVVSFFCMENSKL